MNKAYLSDIQIGQGQFAGESAVATHDYRGELHSGFFEEDLIGLGELEVNILEINKERGLALVTPAHGQQFFETNAIAVELDRLRYDSQE